MNSVKTLLLTATLVNFISCKTERKEETATQAPQAVPTTIEVQGHRGDRGNYPENSLPAFISAINKGANVIEMDVIISKDRQVVVSHEPFMSSVYVLTPTGDSIRKTDEKSYNLHTMMYDSIKKYDAGSKGNKNFPEQHKMKTYKPLLSEVIDSVEHYITANKLKPVHYNIEIKSEPEEYGKSQPEPEQFVAMVMHVINQKGIAGKINIQSFDPMPLKVMHKKHPEVKLSFLTAEPGIEKHLEWLEFTPEIYSPSYKLVNQAYMDSLHAKNMKVIPWTVNDNDDIKEMIRLQVDGIITDYPEKVIDALHQ